MGSARIPWLRAWLPIAWGCRGAGRLSFVWRGFGVHVLPFREFWRWGHVEGWYDGPLHDVGFGPLVLVCWQGGVADALRTASDATP